MVCFWSDQLFPHQQLSQPYANQCFSFFSYDNSSLPIQALDALRNANTHREVSEICSDIIREIIEAASETLEDVCDSLQDLLNI